MGDVLEIEKHAETLQLSEVELLLIENLQLKRVLHEAKQAEGLRGLTDLNAAFIAKVLDRTGADVLKYNISDSGLCTKKEP